MLRRGEWTELFNSLMSALRLRRWISLGESRFFLAEASGSPDRTVEPVDLGGLRLESSSDPAIVAELFDCMEGSRDYDYLSREEIIRRFDDYFRQGSCVRITREESGDIAGFFWTTTSLYTVPCGRRKIVLDLPDDLMIIEFIFVKPTFRRRGVYSKSCTEIRRRMPEYRFACIVDSYNEASIQAHLRLGFRPAGRLRYLNFFGAMLASFRFGRSRKRLFVPARRAPYRRLNAKKA